MTLPQWFRNLFSGAPHVHDTTDDVGEVEATLSEEYRTPARDDASVRQMELASQLPSNSEAAGAAADDIESMEAPPDPDP
jgi:hypothetical protein